MQPRYSLPPVSRASTISRDFKPKQVDAWLKRLPRSDPLQAAADLADYMDTANHTKLSHEVRARMVQALEPAIEEAVAALRGQYSGASLPLTARLRHHPERAQRLLLQLAIAYKHLILSWINQTFHFSNKPLPRYLQRLLLTLQQVLEISYEIHENVPAGVWVDLHQTYHYALRSGLAQTIPEGSHCTLSAEKIYKGMLLMALADPYRMPPIELLWTKDVIERFSDLAQIFPADEAQRPVGLFIIETNTDAPPLPLARERHPTDRRWDLVLNTTGLAKHLAMITTLLKGREDPEKIGLPAAARDPHYAIMLRRLKLSWGASIMRRAKRRRDPRGTELEVCFGLRSVYQLIGPVGGERGVGEPPPVVLRCAAQDDSMGGIALRMIGTLTAQINVGDLVAIRSANGNWSVGLVRWFRVSKEDGLYFGVQLLAPRAQSVYVRRNDTGKLYPGLLLKASPLLKQSAMLLTPPGSIEPDALIDVLSNSGQVAIKVGKRLEYTLNVEVFRIAPA